jgi:hypothetical protein
VPAAPTGPAYKKNANPVNSAEILAWDIMREV